MKAKRHKYLVNISDDDDEKLFMEVTVRTNLSHQKICKKLDRMSDGNPGDSIHMETTELTYLGAKVEPPCKKPGVNDDIE